MLVLLLLLLLPSQFGTSRSSSSNSSSSSSGGGTFAVSVSTVVGVAISLLGATVSLYLEDLFRAEQQTGTNSPPSPPPFHSQASNAEMADEDGQQQQQQQQQQRDGGRLRRCAFVNGWNAWSYCGAIQQSHEEIIAPNNDKNLNPSVSPLLPLPALPSLFSRNFHSGGPALKINETAAAIRTNGGMSSSSLGMYDTPPALASDMFLLISDAAAGGHTALLAGFLSQRRQFGCVVTSSDYSRIALKAACDGVRVGGAAVDPTPIRGSRHSSSSFSSSGLNIALEPTANTYGHTDTNMDTDTDTLESAAAAAALGCGLGSVELDWAVLQLQPSIADDPLAHFLTLSGAIHGSQNLMRLRHIRSPPFVTCSRVDDTGTDTDTCASADNKLDAPPVVLRMNKTIRPPQVFRSPDGQPEVLSVPAGWCSWYHHYDHISNDLLAANIDLFSRLMRSARLGPAPAPASAPTPALTPPSPSAASVTTTTAVQAGPANAFSLFQVDDGYQTAWGDWLSLDLRKFPYVLGGGQGLARLSARIRAAGAMPGLWLAPFAAGIGSEIYIEYKYTQDLQQRSTSSSPNLHFLAFSSSLLLVS
jgi:hypothetical protein